MNLLKRMSALVMVMALLVSAFVAPASAEAVGYPYSGHFSKFPGVWSSKQYSVATVAVQKFLMLAGESLAKLIMPAGGADGYCGGKTVEAIKKFQENEKLHTSGDAAYGKVDRVTWERIATLLEVTEKYVGGDTCIAYFHRFNKSYYTSLDVTENQNVMNCYTAYYAMNDKMQWTSEPFYTL